MGTIVIAVSVSLLLSVCIMGRSWYKGEYGLFIMGLAIFVLMLCSLPVLGQLM